MTEAALLDTARAFAEDAAPRIAGWERTRTYPRETIREAARLGLTGIEVPATHGGLGLPFSAKARTAEILARADFGLAMAILNTQNIAYRLTRGVDPTIAARFLPGLLDGSRIGCTALTEPGAGSDFGAITTIARPDGDGWMIDGEKAWIINAVAADVIVLYAQTAPGSGGRGIASFLIDANRSGFQRTEHAEMTAQHTIGAGGFRLSGYRAEATEQIRPAGEAFKAALTDINGARTYVAAMCCGMVAACLDIATGYGRTRQTFGEPLIRHQGWRMRLAEAETDLEATRLMVADAAARIDAGTDAMLPAARTKIFATRMAERHLPALAHLMGAEGLRDRYPFARHMIGARTASFTDGSTEMLLERLTARHLRDLA